MKASAAACSFQAAYNNVYKHLFFVELVFLNIFSCAFIVYGIQDIPDSFLAVDDTEVGVRSRIPLWLFGFLY